MKTRIKTILRNLSNIPGYRTRRKIVVFESDDWGSIGINNKQDLKKLYGYGIRPKNDDEARYINNDTLASESDLSFLFEALNSFKDINQNPAVFTAMAVVANPDFEKISENNFETYFFEPFTDSLKRFSSHSNSYDLWKEGIKQRIFIPQFHGREHLNITSWLHALQAAKKDTLNAFKLNFYGITDRDPINQISYRAAFDITELSEIQTLKEVIRTGLSLFEDLFGYRATFFVPSNGPFNNHLEKTMFENQINYIGASKIQREPIGQSKYKRKLHYLGQKNKYSQTYLTRNCFFEPSSNLKSDWVGSCLSDINIAFKWKKPAVISTHRVNYIGTLNPLNRDSGLNQLQELLKAILKKWPNTEFMTSNQLGDLVSGKNE